MYPRDFARTAPGRAAIILSTSGERLSYGEMERAANRGAHLFRAQGLKPGDAVALFLDNTPVYFEVYWAAQRSGLYLVPISSRLTASEAAYIVNDCGAATLVLCAEAGPAAEELIAGRASLIPHVKHILFAGRPIAGAQSWQGACEGYPGTPIADETAGIHMPYSSGTTGRPKGIKLPLSGGPAETPFSVSEHILWRYGVGKDTVYLSPAPLYHTAPLVYSISVHRGGGTVVVMEHFEPEAFLAAVERYRVTFTQMVPTMFVRLLKLPPEVRNRYDLSSLKMVVHAAAPCPVPIKRQMMEWLGPIIYEYYGASEGAGGTAIGPQDWLRKPGSVGQASLGVIHVCDEEGKELPPGQTGTIYFEGGLDFQYHNDPAKSAEARHPAMKHWTTVGDVGYVDEDGYLFLSDRKAFMIISGGVNVYPQEAENVLVTHPKVADAAVFGVPHEDFGEEVKAVVQPLDWADAGPELAAELIAYCRSQLSAIKCPRSIDFERELPRHPTGKLYKRQLKDRYWPAKP